MIHVFGSGWGNPDALDEVGWAWFSVPVMGSIIAFVCQVFYGRRFYHFGKGSPLSYAFFGLLVLVSTVQLAAGIWTGVEICIAGKFSLLQSHNLRPTATWLAMTSLSDLLIVCGTVFFLRKSTDPEFKFSRSTNSIVSRVIMLSKIYSNSILLILNSRGHMGTGRECNYTSNYNSVDFSSEYRAKIPSTSSIEFAVHVPGDESHDFI
ncbi:hypothetical protein B0H12DRAFT_1116574 [Mycena haematopus]|nr:hypothetical protein B0H12DRAFT_1116574 [Mycena haematopus]